MFFSSPPVESDEFFLCLSCTNNYRVWQLPWEAKQKVEADKTARKEHFLSIDLITAFESQRRLYVAPP